ncbi:MAG: FKBP-type peptidyl-prolyl cis-trans isomerase [Bacteroidales bacterium]|nr:MAG: FKBP-type peptidyl-prolyl cis-trans isomerase [Bacteroidales bacterium]
MTRFFSFLYSLVFVPIVFVMFSCDNSLEDDKRFAEEKKIESYIAAKKWKYTKSQGVYHIVIEPSYGYEVNVDDTVKFWFKGYTPQTQPLVFDTNIKSEAITASLDTNIRSFEPISVIVGKTDLITGLERGLLSTRLNQKSTIIFTSDLGFKSQIIGPLSAWSPLAYDIQIIYVNGKGIQAEKELLSTLSLSGYNQFNSGLYFKTLVNNTAVFPSSSSIVYGWYKCTLPDGTLVEEVTTENKEIDLADNILGALKVGFTLISEEGSAEFVAPSPMCFGKNGNTIVAPYQPLVFSVRLDSIK